LANRRPPFEARRAKKNPGLDWLFAFTSLHRMNHVLYYMGNALKDINIMNLALH
jgi:hypothetical protein